MDKITSQRKGKGFKPIFYVPVIIVLLVIFASIYFLRKGKTNNMANMTKEIIKSDISFHKQGTLAFISAQGNDTVASINIEIADNDQKRAQGLMYRSSLPADAGMLFIQDKEEIQRFWMKNTYIPLDIVFVDAQKKIVSISPNTATESEETYASDKPALYVVEVNAGFCNQYKIMKGDKIVFNSEK